MSDREMGVIGVERGASAPTNALRRRWLPEMVLSDLQTVADKTVFILDIIESIHYTC